MNPTFKGAVAKLWKSLKARHCGKSKYGPCPITREQFTQWLWEQSEGGLTWKCEYTGNVLQLMAKTQAGRLTLDHQVPLAKGGTSHLTRVILGGLMVTLGAKRRRKPGARQAAVRRILRGYEQRQEERERRRKGLALPKHSPLRRLPIHWAG